MKTIQYFNELENNITPSFSQDHFFYYYQVKSLLTNSIHQLPALYLSSEVLPSPY